VTSNAISYRFTGMLRPIFALRPFIEPCNRSAWPSNLLTTQRSRQIVCCQAGHSLGYADWSYNRGARRTCCTLKNSVVIRSYSKSSKQTQSCPRWRRFQTNVLQGSLVGRWSWRKTLGFQSPSHTRQNTVDFITWLFIIRWIRKLFVLVQEGSAGFWWVQQGIVDDVQMNDSAGQFIPKDEGLCTWLFLKVEFAICACVV